MTDAREVIRRLGLVPLEFEGGFYREMWRDAAGTAIYYLLTSETISRLHRLPKAETWHFYIGDPVTLLLLHLDGTSETVVLGPDLERGQQPQKTVPTGAWQGALLAPGGDFALMGTTVAPAFEQSDFELGRRQELLEGWPEQRSLILRLTTEQPRQDEG